MFFIRKIKSLLTKHVSYAKIQNVNETCFTGIDKENKKERTGEMDMKRRWMSAILICSVPAVTRLTDRKESASFTSERV